MDRRRPAGRLRRWPARTPAVHIVCALAALICITAATAQAPQPVDQRAIMAERPPATLAAYHLFRDVGARRPNTGVTPYDLNTALYSDGALKFRYLFMPPGARATYNAEGVFEFPVGTVLVKTFAFAADMRAPTENIRFLETRLLIRRSDGWIALPYVWNEAQTEARLSLIGATVPVSFTDEDGAAIGLDWQVPNRNQCKGCHDTSGAITPIGPSARNLNVADYFVVYTGSPRDGSRPSSQQSFNQLDYWSREGVVSGAPPSTAAPRAPNAYVSSDGAIAERARAYLDVNCAHCHNPDGPAHTSGLDLRWSASPASVWGVNKRPVAAGRGSAGMEFAIAPGHPERSILLYRMESTDPGVMMPELGRQRVDTRAVALMREWIAGMDGNGETPE